jgi:hypothetical protein
VIPQAATRVPVFGGGLVPESYDFLRIVQNRNDTVLKSALDNSGQGRLEASEMQDLVRYRAMESLCRQSAVFRPLESWRLLAEAEMWHHKAEDEIASRFMECNGAPPKNAVARTESSSKARDGNWPVTS